MKKYIYIFIFIPFLLLGCDYSPIYSKKNNYNFKIEKIEFNGNAEINNLIDKKLKRYKKKVNDKKFSILTSSSYKKISKSKNLSGKTTNFMVTIKANFKIKREDKTKTFIFKEEFLIKNFSNKFKKNNFEKIKKENSIDLIISKLIVQLSRM